MKKYLDRTLENRCIAIFATDDDGKQIEIIQAGTIINSMLIKHKKEYLDLEEKHKIHFIFDDNIPQIDFYTVPLIEIFARDDNGGYFGSVGNMADLDDSETPICYVNKNKNVFKVANCLKEFLFNTDITEELKYKIPLLEIKFFNSLEEAKEELDFINIVI